MSYEEAEQERYDAMALRDKVELWGLAILCTPIAVGLCIACPIGRLIKGLWFT